MSSYLIFTLFYILITGCILYPPSEFISAGLTIECWFVTWLGSENHQFIQYHIKRSVATILTHSLLPVCYVLGLLWCSDQSDPSSFDVSTLQILLSVVLSLPLIALYYIHTWMQNDWKEHPIAQKLEKISNNWISTAADINTEFRRIDKISIEINSISKLIATDNWIIKVTPYAINCVKQNEASLVVCRSSRHDISQNNHQEIQFIDIEVKSPQESFFIRVNALDFKDLQDRIARPITILPTVTFHKTLLERFIDVFKEQIQSNPKFEARTDSLENCIGCMQNMSNVKLQKNCLDSEEPVEMRCGNCNCRPMWCVECIAKWFASRQNQNETDRWLSEKCTCPLCRAKFCVLDVSFIEPI